MGVGDRCATQLRPVRAHWTQLQAFLGVPEKVDSLLLGLRAGHTQVLGLPQADPQDQGPGRRGREGRRNGIWVTSSAAEPSGD